MPLLRRPRSPAHTLRRFAAVLLAAAALALALRPAPHDPAPGGRMVPVVVAAADLPAGTVLTPDDLTLVRLPTAAAPAGVQAEPDSLVGRALAAAMRAREPVSDVRLVGAGLTALLPPGQVAAPVRLADLSVVGLVSAGDRVDVLATAPDAGQAEVVATAALVLATPGFRDPGSGEGSGILLLAVDPPTATRLAAASASATVTVNLAPP